MNETKNLHKEALEYHKLNQKAGKISITPSKPLNSQYDLSLAYSPGVAAPCLEIHEDNHLAYEYTAKGNMVAVISNGTAVLGLGNLGAISSKPVMEGKAVLFKKFADIDAIDIEVNTEDTEEFISVVKNISSTWGGINLEDIKAPECFVIEESLKQLTDVPIFHDDQHGTAIIVAAGLLNAAEITGRNFRELKVVVNGAGAAGIACIELLKTLGVHNENIILCDTKGVVYLGRTEGMNKWKEKHAINTTAKTLSEALIGADVFLGLSAKDAINKDMIRKMSKDPIIFAMANPDPEILPESVLEVHPNAIVATGRSDYNNQINNVMGFPYIFRGALDTRAKEINNHMKIAAVYAIANLAKQTVPDEVSLAYGGKKMKYGRDYIIPVPFDPRLISTIPVAVAKAAIETGVARIEHMNFESYKLDLEKRLNPLANYMNLIFAEAKKNQRKIVISEGEEDESIVAAIALRENQYCVPLLVGRKHKIYSKLSHLGLTEKDLDSIEIVNAANNPNIEQYIDYLYKRLQRKGYLYRDVARMVKTDRNIFSAAMVSCGDAYGMITGLTKNYETCIADVLKAVDISDEKVLFGYSILIRGDKYILIADNTGYANLSSENLSKIAIQSAEIMRQMHIDPAVAFIASSNFGSNNNYNIKEAITLLKDSGVKFEFDGEMNPEIALNTKLRNLLYPFSSLKSDANILIMPSAETAQIIMQLLEQFAGGVFVGPILNGLKHNVQILQIGANATDIIKLATIAAL
jgi:malate dehydrogenase (oxaloacetate-decarboxylating)(NADP+)